MSHRNSGTLPGDRVLKALPEPGRPCTMRHNSGSWTDLPGILAYADLRRVIRTHKSPFYLQVGREQPVTLALLPVESCEML